MQEHKSAEAIARAAPNVEAVARTRSLAAVLASILAVGVTFGIATPLLSLLIERTGQGAVMAGANAAIGTVAVVLAAPFVPRLVRALGVLGAMYAGISVSTVAILLFPMTDNIWLWFVFRFFLGAGMAVLWVVGETWLNATVSPGNRGLVSGIYSTLLGVGFAAGPLVIAGVGVEGHLPFTVGAVLLLVSALPLVLARRLAPRGVGEEEGGLLRDAVHGADDHGGCLRLRFHRHGDPLTAAALWPARRAGRGRRADPADGADFRHHGDAAPDRLGRRQAGAFPPADRLRRGGHPHPAAGTGILGNDLLLWPVLFLWGGTTVSLYTIGLAMLGDRFGPDLLPAANAMMVIAYCMGEHRRPAGHRRRHGSLGHERHALRPGPDLRPVHAGRDRRPAGETVPREREKRYYQAPGQHQMGMAS